MHFFAMILTFSSLLPSPFSGAKPFLVRLLTTQEPQMVSGHCVVNTSLFERTCFFVSFCFSPVVIIFRSVFVFVLVSVLGRSGCGTLPQLLNSERIPVTIRGNCEWELFHRSVTVWGELVVKEIQHHKSIIAEKTPQVNHGRHSFAWSKHFFSEKYSFQKKFFIPLKKISPRLIFSPSKAPCSSHKKLLLPNEASERKFIFRFHPSTSGEFR